jgi:L,D-peptidoglycan transpeptidase YkuD (ErfK/YbiS/YcfS/YnhG family)
LNLPCALGRAGLTLKKREGDGVTPCGVFALRRLHFRPDRVKLPRNILKTRAIGRADWWCDDPADRAYNRLVTSRPMPKDSKEGLQRADPLYDLVIEIGYNDAPAVRGRGSGIFLHLARDGFTPTQGCVALSRDGFLKLLRLIGPETTIRIG